jgi:hypothetical protein
MAASGSLAAFSIRLFVLIAGAAYMTAALTHLGVPIGTLIALFHDRHRRRPCTQSHISHHIVIVIVTVLVFGVVIAGARWAMSLKYSPETPSGRNWRR